MKPYQQRRIAGFLESWANFEDAPYQLKQSLVTLGAGGLHGVGLGRGWQKLSFLPEANTDFVFAVIGEELGLIGTLSLIALWCGLYLSGLRMLNHLDRRRFAYLASFTLLTQLTGQAMLNIAVVTAMVPRKRDFASTDQRRRKQSRRQPPGDRHRFESVKKRCP